MVWRLNTYHNKNIEIPSNASVSTHVVNKG